MKSPTPEKRVNWERKEMLVLGALWVSAARQEPNREKKVTGLPASISSATSPEPHRKKQIQ